MNREIRDASNEVTSKYTGPGPASYNTIAPQLKDRPLTSKKTHNTGAQHFNKARKDTMKVELYDHAYEGSYKNTLGPGPAAYSKMYRESSTDRFKKTAFAR